MQEKAMIAQQKKEFQSMLSTFSHEIRNPLALITSELQMLSDTQPQLCLNEHWDNIMENLGYIRELLDELSRYQNAGHISPVQTDLSLCLDHITGSFRRHWIILASPLRQIFPATFPRFLLIRSNSVRRFLTFFATPRRPSCTLTAKFCLSLLPYLMASGLQSPTTDAA